MGFLVKRVLVTKEATHGVIPTNPVCIEFLSDAFALKQTQATETLNMLGAGGDASPMAFGTSKMTGAVGLVVSTDNAAIIASHVIGAATSSGAATAVAWASSTVTAVGNIVNSVASPTHSLVCVAAGTTGTLESGFVPTLNTNCTLDRGAKIVDGTVTWIAMPKLAAYSFTRQQQLPSLTIEYQLLDETGASFYKRFSNVYMDKLPMAMTGGTISLKSSVDFVGAISTDSTEVGFTSLSAMTGAIIVPVVKEYFQYVDSAIKINNVALCGMDSINLDIVRNVAATDALNACKIVDTGVTAISGTLKRVMDMASYLNFKTNTDFAVEFNFTKANGCKFVLDYPYVRPSLADPDISVDKQAYLSTAISAYGTSIAQSVSATIIAPMLFTSAGVLVGTGSY